jgi:hypothetical protein
MLLVGSAYASASLQDRATVKVQINETSAVVSAKTDDGGSRLDSEPTALIYYDGESDLSQTHTDWLDQLATENTVITETNSVASFESLYRANRYTHVIAITNETTKIAYWKGNVPKTMPFAANWVEPDGRIGMLINAHRVCVDCAVPIDPSQVDKFNGSHGAIDSWWGGIKDWLKRVLPCVQSCLSAFVQALPNDVEMEVTIKIDSTPPGIEATYTIKGNSSQFKQVIQAYANLAACIAGCL